MLLPLKHSFVLLLRSYVTYVLLDTRNFRLLYITFLTYNINEHMYVNKLVMKFFFYIQIAQRTFNLIYKTDYSASPKNYV